MEEFKSQGLVNKYFENSYGWAAFPKVGKAIIGVGGADGQVYIKNERGEVEQIGKSKLALVSGGWSLGITFFSEIIFFENEEAFHRFNDRKTFEFDDDAKVHEIHADETDQQADFGYHNGMATFVLPKKGETVDVSAQGQKFFYQALAT
mmetsp:Transcript_31428/g.64095  ORF Transcript_31428/g.64095 Transcript_31428/m.64095 type:complete len:149 (+) Transcript_31428:119-565(+)